MDNVLFSRTLRQCTFTCLNISVHYETLPFNIIIFLKQVTKDYFCSIFSWLYYLLLQIPPIKNYCCVCKILSNIEINWIKLGFKHTDLWYNKTKHKLLHIIVIPWNFEIFENFNYLLYSKLTFWLPDMINIQLLPKISIQ